MEHPVHRQRTKASFVKDVAHVFSTNAISVPIGFLSAIVIARALGPEGKGAYDLIMATSTLLGIALGFSIPSGITYVVAHSSPNLRALGLRLTGIAFLQSAIAASALFAAKALGRFTLFFPEGIGDQAVVIVPVYLFFSTLAGYWRAMLIGRQEIIHANRRDLGAKSAQFGLLLGASVIMPILRQQLTVGIVLWISVAGVVIVYVLFFQALWVPLRTSVGDSGLFDVVKFALPCYLANLAQFLNYRFDIFVVGFFVGTRGVGLYALAISLAQMMWLFSNAAAIGLLPRIASSREIGYESAKFAARVTRFSLLISTVGGIVFGVLVSISLVKVFGEAFRPSIVPFLLVLPGIVIFSIANTLASYLAGIGKPRLNFLVSLAGLIVTMTLDFLLIPLHGIVGAAIASTLSYLASTGIIIWLFARESKLSILDIVRPTLSDVKLATSYAQGLIWQMRVHLRQISP